MNELCADIGYASINHYGEQLCGDHIEIREQGDDSEVIVLADGLGSGVKASILSTLTSKIISTMMSEGLELRDCVETIAATLPICSERGVAYSTFTMIHLVENREVEIIQYDNPKVILLRDGQSYNYPVSEVTLCEKKILQTRMKLRKGDIFVMMSDGCPHAGMGESYNFGWQRDDIAKYMESICDVGYTAKTMATMLIEECNKLYGGKPGDDASACVIRVRHRVPVNLLFGPAVRRDDDRSMMSLFFSKEGKHVICGGTTAKIASKYLDKPLKPTLDYETSDIPPVSELEGADLVTEGVITMSRVVDYAKNLLGSNNLYAEWGYRHDGASLLSRILFEEATDVNLMLGRAVNPAHQNPDLPINFNIKMYLADELAESLRKMGKRVKVITF